MSFPSLCKNPIIISLGSSPETEDLEDGFLHTRSNVLASHGQRSNSACHFNAWWVSEALLGKPSPRTSGACDGLATAFLGPLGLCDSAVCLPLLCQTSQLFNAVLTGFIKAPS